MEGRYFNLLHESIGEKFLICYTWKIESMWEINSKKAKWACSFFREFRVGFPRDGTSRGTSRDNPGRDVPLSLCPGTKKIPCPVVPLSRDKKSFLVPLSLCPGTKKFPCPASRPGTNSSVPVHPGTKSLSQKTGKGHSKTGKVVLKQKKYILKQKKML